MDWLFVVRLSFVAVCLSGAVLLIRRSDRVVASLRAFFFEPTSATNLALLRIVVFSYLGYCAFGNQAAFYAGLPEGLRKLPYGWEWLSSVVPTAPSFWGANDRLTALTCFFATVGLFTRVSSVVACVTALLAFGFTNSFFKIGHSMHVPMLAAMLCAASPSGDALSIDALLRRRDGGSRPQPSAVYTVAVRFSWLLVGTMYLFPGLWKLWEAGDLWIHGSQLKAELYDKWAQMPEFLPVLNVDRSPGALSFLGSATLVFEIGFFPALFHRTTRWVAGVAAVSFHIGTGLLMNIWFNPFMPLIVFFDWPALGHHPWFRSVASLLARVAPKRPAPLQLRPPQPKSAPRSVATAFVLGSCLLLGMFVTGFAGIDSWPVAIHPRFSHRMHAGPSRGTYLKLVVRCPGRSDREVSPSFLASANGAVATRLARGVIRKGRRGGSNGLFTEVLARLVRREVKSMEPGSRLLIYRNTFAVDPAVRHSVEHRSALVATVDL